MISSQTSFARQLLIAIDENPAALSAIKYCGNLFGNDPGMGFRIIHCSVPSTPSLLSPAADSENTLIPETSLLNQKNALKSSQLLDKGSRILESQGVSSDNIQSSLVPASGQVFQAIALEADKTLADSVVVSRRGIGYFGEMILGSVSASLFRRSPSTPLWIVDGTIASKDILIGVDGSVNALRAVEHVAHMLRNREDITVYLYHCAAFLATDVVCTLDNFYKLWDRDWCDRHLRDNGCLFNGPVQLLKEAGVNSSKIVILPETKNIEESTSIISQAKRHGCGTIVIGRRGPSVAKGFFGGVSNRTIRQTQNMAVWIVG